MGGPGRPGARARASGLLAVRDDWKSLPSGELQNEPAGTELTLRQYADYMISISDNTAADHLIHFLGRNAVTAQLARFGNRDPRADIPFLTTRELFALKGVRYPSGADHYLALPRAARTAVLPALDRISLSQITTWSQPEDIDRLEWFATATDMCRALSGLSRENAEPALASVGDALSLNDGGVGLDRAEYPTVWFKGGSEPGVLTLNHLVRTADGRVLVDSLMLSDPGKAFDEASITAEALALSRGGIQLADRATKS